MTTLSYPTPSPAVRAQRTNWLGLAFVAVIWGYYLILRLLDTESFVGFLSMLGVNLLMTLLFAVWWFTRRAFTRRQRFLAFAAALLTCCLFVGFSPFSLRPTLVLFGNPLVLTLGAVWILATSRAASRMRMGGLFACIALGWGAFLLIRVNGTHGNMSADMHWRWTPTAEQLYLAEQGKHPAAATRPAGRRIELRPGDWPGFRGPGRDGIVRGLSIALDWEKSPPAVLWRQRIGPAWSSMAVVDGCVFTQEQRGGREAVVCRNALTGGEIWVHDRPARFEESMSGVGPRATPTFANGRIYAQGALGALDCLDAGTGALIWTRDIRADAGAALPMWGFCASPLVVGDHVIVFAGGEGKKGLLAYPLDGGAPAWTADAGKVSYASPQIFGNGAQRRIVMFANEGVFAVDAGTGRIVWDFPLQGGVGIPASIQACQIGANDLVLGNGVAFGLQRITIPPNAPSATRIWITRKMKPSFSDMVYYNGYLYGFDGTVFCCIDASTGARRWRDGHYGAGQVVLLADQGVMIVSSEDGQVVLLRCNPDRHEELGQIQAITGKAWNHPAVAGDRLYVRSDGEMACIQLVASGGSRGR
ncbi:MAG TPA: PQQ-binding-like beta-propeller repeat protein [Tepidisphaeraceae bacterium]|nr:PQQ-binding-like beta-propeller repeat protein [Tepidisphaeraceae bacterium]